MIDYAPLHGPRRWSAILWLSGAAIITGTMLFLTRVIGLPSILLDIISGTLKSPKAVKHNGNIALRHSRPWIILLGDAEERMGRERFMLVAFFIGAIVLGVLDYIVSVKY